MPTPLRGLLRKPHGTRVAAAHPVLADIGAVRAERAAEPPEEWSVPDTDLTRLAALTVETGVLGHLLAGPGGHDPADLYTALVDLAASALTWLDELAGQITTGKEPF